MTDSRDASATANQPSIYFRAVVRSDTPEATAAHLVDAAGAEGTEIRDEDAWVDGQPDSDNCVVAYFEVETPEAKPRLRQRVERTIDRSDAIEGAVVRVEQVRDEDWRESWKRYFEPVRLSERVAVGPPWCEVEPPGDAGIALTIEPGMAFGTGMHATTRLVGEILDERLRARETPPVVLDVGCGSGLLAIMASRLGARSVCGVDISPEAIEAARKNAQTNDASEVALSTRPVAQLETTADLVVANIVTSVLNSIRDPLFESVGDEGELVVSGILREHRDEFLDEFVPLDWQVAENRELEEWAAARICRRD